MTYSPVQQRFAGQVVIVTGAGAGIGRATATAFAREGALVYGIDIDRHAVERAAQAATSEKQTTPEQAAFAQAAFEQAVSVTPARFVPMIADVANPSDISTCVERVLTEAGRVDVLVNNAGINMGKRLVELEIGDWERVFDVNLRSVYLFCKAIWPNFVSRHKGVIVNVSSVMGQVGGVGSPAYCSTKAAIIMLSRCLAKDGARDGIRVNSVCPGYIDTPIMERVLRETGDPAKARQAIVDKMPLGRMGAAEEVALGILFLASGDAGYISGTELTIDGAVTATQID